MIAQYHSKNCVRLTTSSPASPKQEAPKRGRSGAGAGMCRVRRTTPSPPSQEWHDVASGEACAYAVLRTSSPASPKRLPRGGDQERGRRGCVVYAVRPHRPPPKSGMVWRVARLVVSTCVCVGCGGRAERG